MGFVGGRYNCSGKYKIKKDNLILLGNCKEEEKFKLHGKHYKMPRNWKIEKDCLKNNTNKGFTKLLKFNSKDK